MRQELWAPRHELEAHARVALETLSRVGELERQVLDVAKSVTPLIEALNDRINDLESENLELRALVADQQKHLRQMTMTVMSQPRDGTVTAVQ